MPWKPKQNLLRSNPKAFPQINKHESNFPCSLSNHSRQQATLQHTLCFSRSGLSQRSLPFKGDKNKRGFATCHLPLATCHTCHLPHFPHFHTCHCYTPTPPPTPPATAPHTTWHHLPHHLPHISHTPAIAPPHHLPHHLLTCHSSGRWSGRWSGKHIFLSFYLAVCTLSWKFPSGAHWAGKVPG